jgi:hypothetical protein
MGWFVSFLRATPDKLRGYPLSRLENFDFVDGMSVALLLFRQQKIGRSRRSR